MKHLTAVGLIAIGIIACGRGSSNDDGNVPSDAQALAGSALQIMQDAPSYKATFSLQGEEDQEDAQTSIHWTVEFQQPDNYRVLIDTPEGESGQVCDERTSANGFESNCRSVMKTITGESVLEAILIGDQEFVRECSDVGQGCTNWQEEEREDIPAFGLSTLFVPGWPLIAVEQAEFQREDGRTLQGHVNFERAVIENMHRLAEKAGWSEEEFQDFAGVDPVDDTFAYSPNAEITLQLSGDNHILALNFGYPGTGAGISVEYSSFGEITVEPPE